MKPPKSILDRSFEYVPSAQTDLRKTFARLRREEKAKAGKEAEALRLATKNVTDFKGQRRG